MKRSTQPLSEITSQKQASVSRGVPVPGLSQVRREKALSQDELARHAGVSTNTIGRLERGANARFSAIARLATALGITRRRLLRP
jgi:DNA-binding XRE family transcriptional regulator